MDRPQYHEDSTGSDLHEARAAQLLERIQQNTRILAARAFESQPGHEPFGMMRRVAEDLERVAAPLLMAVEHCSQILDAPVLENDIAMLRDTTHLYARIEAMVSQLEDTVRTLERLTERPAHLSEPVLVAEGGSGDGSYERVEQPDRPSLPRALRSLTPVIEA